jgi:hypothetical protein
MARTNKMWILKKKQQQAKQKQLVGGEGVSDEWIKREYENPKGNTTKRFMRSGKWINDITSVREDPDGFRLKRSANSGDTEFVHRGITSRGYRKYIRKAAKAWRK